MFSALTKEGAKETLDALDAGAMDFLPKEIGSSGVQEANRQLLERVRGLGRSSLSMSRTSFHDYRYQPAHVISAAQFAPKLAKSPELVVIGASTGGPVALRQVLSVLPHNFPLPVIAAVHMPGSFTTTYAERLDSVCSIKIREAVDRDLLKPGLGLIAPGGKQMRVERSAGGYQLRISEPLQGEIYHPSVDILLSSVAESYQDRALGIVLTGMGSDGAKGAKQLKQKGATLWSQDEKSCVVYGMPQAVEKAGLSDRVVSLEEIGPLIARLK
jgi:two-component system, chemotaxis family, protein-glutamate methylesterase/glutaminase